MISYELRYLLVGDSVWNFHVWNEVFLRGTGHWPEKYAGWAAVDATPQESSNGMMQCGPAPLKVNFYFVTLLLYLNCQAIKNGEIYIGYDTNFVFGEVNADQITWVCTTEDNSILIKGLGQRYSRSVGYNISTKVW